jgi:hypothetical protein
MDERDLEAEEPFTRSFVDQLGTAVQKLAERRRQVGDLIRHVVHALPALGEELADRCLLAQRGEKLDAALSEPDRRRLDALILDGGAVLDRRAEQLLVRRDGIVKVFDRDAEVVNAKRLHAFGC